MRKKGLGGIKEKISDTQIWGNSIILLTLFAAMMICVIGFYKLVIQENLMVNYLEILVFISIGYLLCRGDYFQRKRYFFYFFFIAWLVLVHWLRGEILMETTERAVFVMRCLICGIALPFAHVMHDADKKKYMNIALSFMILIGAVLCVLCLWGIVRGENISLFDGKVIIGATYDWAGTIMLKMMNLHYYRVGFFAVVCFFTTMYLMASYGSRWSMLFGSVLLLLFGSIVILCCARTAIFAWIAGIIIVIYVFLQRICVNKSIRRVVTGGVIAGGVVSTVLGMNYLYSAVNVGRDIWYSITTLTGRTLIWQSLMEVLKDNPRIMLLGLPHKEIMELLNQYYPEDKWLPHIHSGYLTTLADVGIVGLIAIIAFCIYLIISSCKILFTESKGRYSISDKLMITVPAACIAMNLVESVVFFNVTNMEIMNIPMALFAGCIIEKAWHKEEKEG